MSVGGTHTRVMMVLILPNCVSVIAVFTAASESFNQRNIRRTIDESFRDIAAVMAEAGDPAAPRSLTLMAGPIDCRINPTEVNKLATGRSIQWFERMMVDTVPPGFKGAGRRVYPGFLQLTAFLQMNVGNHVKHPLEAYVDILNVTNRLNPEGYDYNYDFTMKTASFGLPIIPAWSFSRWSMPRFANGWRNAAGPSACRR